jgi:hypothetical protein
MNTKNIILISSVLVILGLTVGLVLNKLTLESFGVISGLVLTSLYGLYQKFENVKVTNEKLELENEIKAYEHTVSNKNETIKEKNILLSLKDIAFNNLLEENQKKDKEIKSQENRLKDFLNSTIDKNLNVGTIETHESFKDETPKVIKRQYNKKKK